MPSHTERCLPPRIVSIAPNVAKPRSRGRVWITSDDALCPPAIDYRYFTDPDGCDEATLIAGIRLARRIAEQAPMSEWIVREVFPGPELISDEDLSAALRATHQTVYHVSGTCRMGAGGRSDGGVRPAPAGPWRDGTARRGRVGVPDHPVGESRRHRHGVGRAGQ